MISLPAGSRIWLVAGITDMRNGFNGLASKVQNVLKDDPFSGHLFIFRGRRGDQIKVLWADSDGLCLFTKRLERGRFVWPVTRDGKVHPRFYVSTSKSIIKALINMHSFEIQLSPIG